MTAHDPLCPRVTGGDCTCSAAASLDVAPGRWEQEENSRTVADLEARIRNIRAETLADLRAKVEEWRDDAFRFAHDPKHAVASSDFMAQGIGFDRVLDLIDEAGR